MKKYNYYKPMSVSMPESLYSVVYSETAFRALTRHPYHFHTLEDAQKFVDQFCQTQNAYIIQVPVVATRIVDSNLA